MERHRAVICFSELLPYIIGALEDIEQWDHTETRATACQLKKAITDFEFLVSLEIMSHISRHLIILSKSLQTVGKDISQALQEIDVVINLLEGERMNTVEYFSKVYNNVRARAISVDIVERRPRSPG